MAQSNPEIQSGRKKCHHSIQDHGPKSICAVQEFYTKSSGTDILAHSIEISAPGSVNQQLLIYPDPARRADLPGGFNQLRSHQNIETINYHPLFDSAAKVPWLERVEYLKSSHQTAASRYFTPSASVHQNGSKSPSGCHPAAPHSAPNECGNRPGKRNLWAKEFHFPSFHLCCNKAGCGWQPRKIQPAHQKQPKNTLKKGRRSPSSRGGTQLCTSRGCLNIVQLLFPTGRFPKPNEGQANTLLSGLWWPSLIFCLNEQICLKKKKKRYMKYTNQLQMVSLTSSALLD